MSNFENIEEEEISPQEKIALKLEKKSDQEFLKELCQLTIFGGISEILVERNDGNKEKTNFIAKTYDKPLSDYVDIFMDTMILKGYWGKDFRDQLIDLNKDSVKFLDPEFLDDYFNSESTYQKIADKYLTKNFEPDSEAILNLMRAKLSEESVKKYLEDAEALSMHDLVYEIQPLVNLKIYKSQEKNPLLEDYFKGLVDLYVKAGGDKSYFTCGAGAPGNCSIM